MRSTWLLRANDSISRLALLRCPTISHYFPLFLICPTIFFAISHVPYYFLNAQLFLSFPNCPTISHYFALTPISLDISCKSKYSIYTSRSKLTRQRHHRSGRRVDIPKQWLIGRRGGHHRQNTEKCGFRTVDTVSTVNSANTVNTVNTFQSRYDCEDKQE